ncbi:MAG: HD domain-containing protein [Nanoarchaeota archaeon]|nr:HD domain-containing protein [Nanoarchaeota archaeon]
MFISSSLYRFVELNDLQEELLETPEIQRLRYLKQLAVVDKVFPDATHTRFAHAIGVSNLAGEFAIFLKLEKNEKFLVQAAGLLHDVGHPPFSHVTNRFLKTILGDRDIKNHEDLSRQIVEGQFVLNLPGAGQIPNILQKYGLDPKVVGELVTNSHTGKPYLQAVISGGVDADKLDYLRRDSESSGVVSGNIDQQRILQLALINNNHLEFDPKAISPVKEMLQARSTMYNEVYNHRTAHVVTRMLQKALQMSFDIGENKDFYNLGDEELMMRLMNSENKQIRNLALRIKYRKLYKIAFQIRMVTTDQYKELVDKLKQMGEQRIEAAFQQRLNMQPGEVLAAFPKVQNISFQKLFELRKIRIFNMDGKNTNYSYFNVYCDKSNVERVKQETRAFLERMKTFE